MEAPAGPQFIDCMGVEGSRQHFDGEDSRARDARIASVVEAYIRHLREGGSSDPEPFLERLPELRGELDVLLRTALRVECAARWLDGEAGLDGAG